MQHLSLQIFLHQNNSILLLPCTLEGLLGGGTAGWCKQKEAFPSSTAQLCTGVTCSPAHTPAPRCSSLSDICLNAGRSALRLWWPSMWRRGRFKHGDGLGVSLRSVATRTDNNLKIIDIIIDYWPLYWVSLGSHWLSVAVVTQKKSSLHILHKTLFLRVMQYVT